MKMGQARAEEVEFYVYGKESERVKECEYLGRVLTENNDDLRCINI